MRLKYFKIGEFDSPGDAGSGSKMNKEFMSKLDKARGLADIPFIVNSGYRTPEHNKEIGGVEGSSHVGGYAVDLSVTDSSSRFLIFSALLAVGFNRIGMSGSFVHVDNDPNKAEYVFWTYK